MIQFNPETRYASKLTNQKVIKLTQSGKLDNETAIDLELFLANGNFSETEKTTIIGFINKSK